MGYYLTDAVSTRPDGTRARWYDPITGRWLSNDPIGISGGLDQYVFCGNNPVNFSDPSGLEIKKYPNLQDAIVAACMEAHSRSQYGYDCPIAKRHWDPGLEWFGIVVKWKDGSGFSFSPPRPGRSNESWPWGITVPKNADLIAYYHSHPTTDFLNVDDLSSTLNHRDAKGNIVPIFVGTTSGLVIGLKADITASRGYRDPYGGIVIAPTQEATGTLDQALKGR